MGAYAVAYMKVPTGKYLENLAFVEPTMGLSKMGRVTTFRKPKWMEKRSLDLTVSLYLRNQTGTRGPYQASVRFRFM